MGTSNYHVRLADTRADNTTEEDGWSRADFRILIGPHTIPEAKGCHYRGYFPPGGAHKKHYHEKSDEIVYVIQGHGAHGQGDDEWEVGPGSSYYIPHGVVHWLRNLDPVQPIEVIGVYFDAGSLEETGYVYLGPVQPEDMKVK